MEYAHKDYCRRKPILYLLETSLFKDVIATCGQKGACYCRNDGMISLSGTIQIERWNLTSGASYLVDTQQVDLASGELGEQTGLTSFLAIGASHVAIFHVPTVRFQIPVPEDPNVIDLVSVVDEKESFIVKDHVVLWDVPKEMDGSNIRANITVLSIEKDTSDQVLLITLRSNRFALFVYLTTILPGRFDENCFQMLPGIEKVRDGRPNSTGLAIAVCVRSL